MKKALLTIILTLVLVTGLTVSPYALENAHDGVTVVFNEDSIFTDAEKEIIIDYFNSENNEQAEPYGLTCTLFGHDYKDESVYTITHKVYDTAPRCVKEDYYVQVCTRCSHTESQRVDVMRIFCCP